MDYANLLCVTGHCASFPKEKLAECAFVITKKFQLKKVRGVKMIDFSNRDVIRHPLVKEIVRAYDEWEKGGDS